MFGWMLKRLLRPFGASGVIVVTVPPVINQAVRYRWELNQPAPTRWEIGQAVKVRHVIDQSVEVE